MTFLARMAQFLFWLLFVSWGVALLGRLLSWMLRRATPRAGPDSIGASKDAQQAGASKRLHRDPVCGVHVSEDISFPLREGGSTLHFCSEDCRARYAGSQRFTVNG